MDASAKALSSWSCRKWTAADAAVVAPAISAAFDRLMALPATAVLAGLDALYAAEESEAHTLAQQASVGVSVPSNHGGV